MSTEAGTHHRRAPPIRFCFLVNKHFSELFFSLSLFLIVTSLFAQNYLYNEPQWRQEFFFGGNGSVIENQQYVYDLDGDSVVGVFTYKNQKSLKNTNIFLKKLEIAGFQLYLC